MFLCARRAGRGWFRVYLGTPTDEKKVQSVDCTICLLNAPDTMPFSAFRRCRGYRARLIYSRIPPLITIIAQSRKKVNTFVEIRKKSKDIVLCNTYKKYPRSARRRVALLDALPDRSLCFGAPRARAPPHRLALRASHFPRAQLGALLGSNARSRYTKFCA